MFTNRAHIVNRGQKGKMEEGESIQPVAKEQLDMSHTWGAQSTSHNVDHISE